MTYNPDDEAHIAEHEREVRRLKGILDSAFDLLETAPTFFAPQYDFEGRKIEWIRASNRLMSD